MENLLNSIKERIIISAALEKALTDAFQTEIIQKNHLLVKEGQYVRNLYFLSEGIIRSFYHGKDKEVSTWFYNSGQFFTCWYSFHSQLPGFENLEALESSTIFSIKLEDYKRLMDEFPEFQRFGRLLAEEQLSFIDYYSKGYMFLSAKERYDLLLTYFPEIELHVKLGYIASFLGISQETLSRIRNLT